MVIEMSETMSKEIICEDNCLECKVYNHEKFYCPKWCSVIKNTIADTRANTIDECIDLLEKYHINGEIIDDLEKLKTNK